MRCCEFDDSRPLIGREILSFSVEFSGITWTKKMLLGDYTIWASASAPDGGNMHNLGDVVITVPVTVAAAVQGCSFAWNGVYAL